MSFFWEAYRFKSNLKPNCPFQDCFKKCAAGDLVLLSFGLHEIKFFEPLNSHGYIKAIGTNENKESFLDASKNAVIRCEEDDNVLLTFNGDFTLENVTLDCRNVRLGIWCMRGTVTLKNCYLIGDATSATGDGVKVSREYINHFQFCTLR